MMIMSNEENANNHSLAECTNHLRSSNRMSAGLRRAALITHPPSWWCRAHFEVNLFDPSYRVSGQMSCSCGQTTVPNTARACLK